MKLPIVSRYLLPIVFSTQSLALPEPQSYTYAPFSGAIYIVNPNGQQIQTQGTNMCPSSASVSCSNMGQPSWCCPSGYTCASPANSNGLIGCCPSGSSCGGSINAAAITTVTVTQGYPVTEYQTVVPSTVYVQPTTQVYVQSAPNVYETQSAVYGAGQYCQTITMSGPDLPTVKQGPCGLVLVVSEGAKKAMGWGSLLVVVLLNVALGRMFGLGTFGTT